MIVAVVTEVTINTIDIKDVVVVVIRITPSSMPSLSWSRERSSPFSPTSFQLSTPSLSTSKSTASLMPSLSCRKCSCLDHCRSLLRCRRFRRHRRRCLQRHRYRRCRSLVGWHQDHQKFRRCRHRCRGYLGYHRHRCRFHRFVPGCRAVDLVVGRFADLADLVDRFGSGLAAVGSDRFGCRRFGFQLADVACWPPCCPPCCC